MRGPLTLAQIATQLGGRVAGDPGVLIRQVGSLERAPAGQIAFLSNPKFRAKLEGTGAAAVVMATLPSSTNTSVCDSRSLTRISNSVPSRPAFA